jgi:hypothetical protein
VPFSAIGVDRLGFGVEQIKNFDPLTQIPAALIGFTRPDRELGVTGYGVETFEPGAASFMSLTLFSSPISAPTLMA